MCPLYGNLRWLTTQVWFYLNQTLIYPKFGFFMVLARTFDPLILLFRIIIHKWILETMTKMTKQSFSEHLKKNLISTNHCQNNWDCFTALVDIPKNFWSEPWKTANIIPVVIFESPYYHSLSLIIDYSPLLSPIMHWVYYSRVPNNRPRPILL